MNFYRKAAVALFGRWADSKGFRKLHPHLQAAGIKILVKAYASVILLSSALAFIATLAALWALLWLGSITFLTFLPLIVTLPVFASLSTFAFLYFYPAQKAASVRKSLENDLPFAIAHLSSIASSGIPPEAMFELLTNFREYRQVATHASLVVRNIRTFGMSSTSAIASVADASPSPEFRQVLNGIAFTIEKGGNLPAYLNEIADKALFDYRIRREKYLKTLGTYADIYTALVVAAPLMMLALLGILSIIGGEIVGLPIGDVITLLTLVVLPGLNIAFLAFIHLTYPGA